MNFLEEFFKVYGIFISVDAYYSLSYEGRNRELINNLYDALSEILNQQHSNDALKEKFLKDITTEIFKYQKDKSFSITNNKQIDIDRINRYDLTPTIKLFYAAAREYAEYTNKLDPADLKQLHIKNFKDDIQRKFANPLDAPKEECITQLVNKSIPRTKSMLKQSLMEFNNALAHTYTALTSDKDDITESNLHRAQGHLHRSCLDFYKAIIKDLAFLGKTNGFEQQILDTRENEYHSIGNDHIDREGVIGSYAILVRLIQGLPIEDS